VLVATGVDADGYREVLGLDVMTRARAADGPEIAKGNPEPTLQAISA
jgi:hypothetical protein